MTEIKKRDIANFTGGVTTDDGRELYGLDAETYLKIKAKENPNRERRLGEWLETFLEIKLEDPGDLHISLKNGIVLILLMNKLRPGIIAKYNQEQNGKKLHALAETANIQLYLRACEKMGIAKSNLFDPYDLHARRNMPAVMNNLETMSTLRVYDSSSGQLQAPQTKLDAVPPKERTQSKTWKQVETSPAVVHVSQISEDQVYEELIKAKKELHEMQRKNDYLQSEVNSLRRKVSMLEAKADVALQISDDEGPSIAEEETIIEGIPLIAPASKKPIGWFRSLLNALFTFSG
jgi:hypothetical protein